MRKIYLLLFLLYVFTSIFGAPTWTQLSITNSGYGTFTRTPGGYSRIDQYQNKIYGIDLCSRASGFYTASIYQNCLYEGSYNAATNTLTRTLIDTSFWADNATPRTIDTIPPNYLAPTPPNRHFIFAIADNGKLFTAAGLNNKIKVNRVFLPDSVNLSTDEISFPNTTPFSNLDEVTFNTTVLLPTGLSTGTSYYVIRVSATKIKVASSVANARAGTAVNLNTSTGAGIDTIIRVVANHPNDTWTTTVTTRPIAWTQVFPPADSVPINSGVYPSMTYDPDSSNFIVTPIADNLGGSSQRTYLLEKNSPYNYNRLTQSYNNGDAPGVSSGQGCAYNTRDKKTYCIGGGNSFSPLNRLWRYTKSTKLWDTLNITNRPRSRVQHCVVHVPGATSALDSIWVIGGYVEASNTKLRDARRCSYTTLACDSVAATTLPTATTFSYCQWHGPSGRIILRQADASTDEYWSMPAGQATGGTWGPFGDNDLFLPSFGF